MTVKSHKIDTFVAAVLVAFSVAMIQDSFHIRDLGFRGLKPEQWPRGVLWCLLAVSLVYLAQSLLGLLRTREAQADATPFSANALVFIKRYKNASIAFALFFAFLYTLDYFGMLLGGALFTFLLLSALGGWSPRQLLLHAVVAAIAIGAMWSIFTFALHVMLPEGELLRVW